MEGELEESTVNELNMALATVLILVALAPQAVYHSQPWNALVASVGNSTARSIVVYWSLRTTLQEANILFSSVGEQGPGGGSRAA